MASFIATLRASFLEDMITTKRTVEYHVLYL